MAASWQRAIDGHWDAIPLLCSRGANTYPTKSSVRFDIRPSREAPFVPQATEDDCAESAIRNAGGHPNATLAKDACYKDVALAVNGKVLHASLTKDCRDGRGKRVPHLVYTYDDVDECTQGFLLPYCKTASNQLVCAPSDGAINTWMQEYSTFVMLYEHAIANPEGHYVVLERHGSHGSHGTSQWSLICGVGGTFHIPATVALLLMRGCVSLIACGANTTDPNVSILKDVESRVESESS